MEGKQPKTGPKLVQNLWRDATNDLDTVRRWFCHPQVTDWGVHLGQSGLLVVDVDPRHLGRSTTVTVWPTSHR